MNAYEISKRRREILSVLRSGAEYFLDMHNATANEFVIVRELYRAGIIDRTLHDVGERTYFMRGPNWHRVA